MLQTFSGRNSRSIHGGDVSDNDDDDDDEDESTAGEMPSIKGRGLAEQNHTSDVMSSAVSESGMSDLGFLDNQTLGDNSVEEVAFDSLNKEIQATIPEKPVRTVIKLCFSSMAVVFRETVLTHDPEQPPFQYNSLPSIPMAAARMLWSELLGGIECTVSGKTEEYIAKAAPSEFGGELDESITMHMLRGFLSAVNRKENKALALLRTGKNLFKRKESNDSSRNIRSIEAMEEKKKSKDPFLHFVRLQLLKAELIDLSGRRFYDSIQSLGDSNVWQEDDDDESVDSLNDEEMDISGWRDQKRPRKSQSLVISSELNIKYGLMLSRRLVKSGGFALPVNTQEAYAGSNGDSTMRRWDERMADACARKLHRQALLEPRIVEQENGDEIEVDEEPWMKVRSNNPFGDGTTYALKMYPTHLMRSGFVVDAARTLMAPRFLLGRVIIYGVLKACQRHRADLEELCLRSELALEGQFDLGGDGAGIDAEDISFAAFHVMSTVVTGRFDVPPEQQLQQQQSTSGKNKAADTAQLGDAGRAMHLIASLFAEKGDFAQAMDCFTKSVRYKKAAFGPDHPSVSRSYMNLGQCYVREREFDDAIVWFSEALRIEREQSVVNSERMTGALASLALVYGLLNEHEKAVELYTESLDILKDTVGSDHVKVADNLKSLGIVYGLMGDLDKAAQHYLDAIAIKEKQEIVFEDQIADLRFNLGLVYGKRGDNAAALSCFEEVLKVRRERYGDDDKDVGRTYHHIGEALADLGRLDDALENFEEAYRIRKGVLGDEHEDVADTLQCMGLVYYEHSDLEMALSFLEDALRIFQRRFGLRSEKAADSLHAMGLVYHAQTNYDQAIRSYQEALQIRQACLGDDHVDVASTHHNLGDVYFMQGDLLESLVEYTKARRIREKQLGDENEEVSTTLNNMGVVLTKQGNQVQAMECLDHALRIRETLFGKDHIKCSDTLHNMGLVHKNNQDYELAIERYEEAARIRRLDQTDQTKVADTLYNLAIVYCKMGSYAQALSICQEVEKIYHSCGLSEDHPSVVHTLQWIKWCQRKLAKLGK